MSRQRKKSQRQSTVPEFYDSEADPIQAIANEIMAHPSTREMLGKVSGVFDDFAYAIDKAARSVTRGNPAREKKYKDMAARAQRIYEEAKKAEARAQRKPAQNAGQVREQNSRRILGFSPSESLTPTAIKERQRALALAMHPDKNGGSTFAMQQINAAASVLLILTNQ